MESRYRAALTEAIAALPESVVSEFVQQAAIADIDLKSLLVFVLSGLEVEELDEDEPDAPEPPPPRPRPAFSDLPRNARPDNPDRPGDPVRAVALKLKDLATRDRPP